MIKHPYRSILGATPADWGVKPLNKLLVPDGCTAGDWGDESGDTAIQVIRSTNFTNDGHFDSSEIAVRHFGAEKAGTLNLKKFDILVEKSGGSPDQPVGRVLQIPEDMSATWFSNFIHRIRPDPSKIVPRYLFWLLHELHCCGIIERLQTQTTQMRNLEIRDYLSILIPVPPSTEQTAICTVLDAADRKIAHCKELIGISGSLRRDSMRGPLNDLKSSLLHSLTVGTTRLSSQHA